MDLWEQAAVRCDIIPVSMKYASTSSCTNSVAWSVRTDTVHVCICVLTLSEKDLMRPGASHLLITRGPYEESVLSSTKVRIYFRCARDSTTRCSRRSECIRCKGFLDYWFTIGRGTSCLLFNTQHEGQENFIACLYEIERRVWTSGVVLQEDVYE